MSEPDQEVHPTTEEDVEEVARHALATKSPLEVLGGGSKRAIGHSVATGTRLCMDHLTGILSYEPGELVLSAWAGTPMLEIEAILAAEGQHLAFEPPDYAGVTGTTGSGTLGGAIAAGFAGPRRLVAGSARDHILGLTGVTGRGETFKIGGRVVKNVTGYDLSKLIAGSFGTLAVMTRVTVRVLPRPETGRTLRVGGPEREAALELLRLGAASPFGVTGAVAREASDGDVECLFRLEGREDEIDIRASKLMEHLGCDCQVIRKAPSLELWRSIRDLADWNDKDVIWRVNLPRAKAFDMASRIQDKMDCDFIYDWAGARILAAPRSSDVESRASVREIAASAGGTAMLFKASNAMKAQIPVFHPEPQALASLTARVRDAFDPERILNPGRMGEP